MSPDDSNQIIHHIITGMQDQSFLTDNPTITSLQPFWKTGKIFQFISGQPGTIYFLAFQVNMKLAEVTAMTATPLSSGHFCHKMLVMND